jgi:hypothetical protein
VRIVLVVTWTYITLAMNVTKHEEPHIRTQVEVVVLGVTNADEEEEGVNDSYKSEAS